MNAPDKDEEVGYCKPPKSSQWQKGQCGNPGRRGTRPRQKIWQTIEKALAKEITVTENGVSRCVTVLEGIVLQILVKCQSGNQKAVKVLKKYEGFAKTKPDYELRPAEDPAEGVERYRKFIYGE